MIATTAAAPPTPMSAPLFIHVAPVTPTLEAGVRAIELAREQHAYVGDPGFNLDDALRDPSSQAMAILANGRVIGFYRLDFAPRAVLGRSLGAPHAGLRALCLDRRVQGHGLAARALGALLAHFKRTHPRTPLLALAVHCSNLPALAAYRRAGFVPTGELMPGGRAGPQHVMLAACSDRLPHA